MKVSRIIAIISIVFLVLLLFSIFVYLYYDIKVKPTELNATKEPVDPAEQENEKRISNILLWSFIFALALLFLFVIFKFVWWWFGPQEEETSLIKRLSVEEAQEIFKKKFCEENDVPWYLDEEGKFCLSNEKSMWIMDQKVTYDKPTGNKLLIFEVVLNEGLKQGVHTVVINLDEGKEELEKRSWRIDHNTNFADFKFSPRTYPMASVVDKEERKQYILAELYSEGNLNPEELRSLNEPQNVQSDQEHILRQDPQKVPALIPPTITENYEPGELDEYGYTPGDWQSQKYNKKSKRYRR